jgi:hypothetical protein
MTPKERQALFDDIAAIAGIPDEFARRSIGYCAKADRT